MNEWGFAAEIKSWWDEEFPRHPDWRLTRCEVEQAVEPGGQRSDLVVIGGGVTRLCGEIRLPDHPVSNPWHPDNLLNAINKATHRGSRWAFTSDGTTLLLIDTMRSGPPSVRVVQEIPLVSFTGRSELDSEAFLLRLRDVWVTAIREIAPIVVGIAIPKGMAPDELFVNSLRALLSAPVAAIRDELNRRRIAEPQFAEQLVVWMVDRLLWSHVPDQWEAEILRASRLTAYVLTTRLMFYEALRRSKADLPALSIPVASAHIARTNLKAYFEEARSISGDYETLFSWDQAFDFALVDAGLGSWGRVVEHLASFDLTNIGYDVLGKMFERLIDPNERYRWGQHYTSPDVVDLMLSFAIPDGRGRVLDPAAGGGTFLVRAYVRKRVFNPTESHQQILSELYGLDISPFAASLATVNLAIRHLGFEDNYPQIAAKSFFQVDPAEAFMALPSPQRVSLDEREGRDVAIEPVRAVVCNPPYVRLHELGRDRQDEAKKVLEVNRSVPVPPKLHGLSNYHVYFWLHSAQFLEPDGRLVVIAAGEWLDSDYGAVLQKWLMDHFEIECCIESLAEPWFSEARVGTVVVVARLSESDSIRNANRVRFVLLRRPLRELYGDSASDVEHIRNVDALRDRLMSLVGDFGESKDFDWSTATQDELRGLGTAASEGRE